MLVLDWISHNIILFNMVVWQVMKIPIYSEYNACNIAYTECFAILFTFLCIILAFLSQELSRKNSYQCRFWRVKDWLKYHQWNWTFSWTCLWNLPVDTCWLASSLKALTVLRTSCRKTGKKFNPLYPNIGIHILHTFFTCFLQCWQREFVQ